MKPLTSLELTAKVSELEKDLAAEKAKVLTLEKDLADERAKRAALECRKAATTDESPAAQPWPDTLIIAKADHEKLTPEQQHEFRRLHGTVTE